MVIKHKLGVKAFQSRYGFPVTGNVDDQTLQSILWAYGNLKIAKKPTPTPTPATTTPKPTPIPQVPSTTGLTVEEQQMLDLVNKERTAVGLSPLGCRLGAYQNSSSKKPGYGR